MRYLLDTHALIWAFEGDARLSRKAARILTEVRNAVSVSIASYWELQIKQTVGKLRVAANYNPRLCAWLDEERINWLTILQQHCDRYRSLALHHRDPFDRMLVAQAQVEGLAILTADRRFKSYDVKVVWD
jgi:PIN domain nuclease of toxin-antitoxin system